LEVDFLRLFAEQERSGFPDLAGSEGQGAGWSSRSPPACAADAAGMLLLRLPYALHVAHVGR
jgi:hypothetical protein